MRCVEFEALKECGSPTVYFCEHEMKGSVAKFLNRQNKPHLVCRIYTVLSSCCNSLYVEKPKFSCELWFCLYIA
ncbi:hypothetical protein CN636_33320 [Bacillus toyonensis]|nr:hypothetical protein CN636_33320 [Bacillus toyonensis]